MLRHRSLARPAAHRARAFTVRACIGALAALAATGCADQRLTAPPSTAASFSLAAQQGGKPTRADVPDALQTGVLPAGVACSFPVANEPVTNRLVTTTFPADANGDVVQLTTGTVVMRVTNVETGKSLTLNISGPGRFTFRADGTTTLETWGNWVNLGRDPVTGEVQFLLTSGRVVVDFAAPNTFGTFTSMAGRASDLCAALS